MKSFFAPFTTSISVRDFSEKLQQVHSDFYTNDVIDAVTKYDLPDNANLIPTELSISSRSDGLRDELINFRESTGRHGGNVEQVIMPVSIDNEHFSGLHIKRNNDGSYAASYIDPLGGEEKTLFEKTTKQIREYIFGKTEKSEITAQSYLGPIPRHIVEVLEDVLNINPQDIAVTTNKLQYSMRGGFGIREATDNNCGPIVADILISLANANVVVSGTRLTALEGHDIPDRSEHYSKVAGEVLRNFHAATLIDIYPDQAAKLEAMKLEESGLERTSTKKNFRGPNGINEGTDHLSNRRDRDQIGGGISAGRVIELVAKAVAFGAILSSTNSNNQQVNTGSSLTAGGDKFGNLGSVGFVTGGERREDSRILTARPPTFRPTSSPSGQPTTNPTSPTSLPTSLPSAEPSDQPSTQPSAQPSVEPSSSPTVHQFPTSTPTLTPTVQQSPIPAPTSTPTISAMPTTAAPTAPTGQPSSQPSSPSGQPSSNPTSPTSQPTEGDSNDDRYFKEVPNDVVHGVAGAVGGVIVLGVIGVAVKAAIDNPSSSPVNASANASSRRKNLNTKINDSRI